MSFLKSNHQIKRCPKTTEFIQSILKCRWLVFLYPFIGLAALLWFLVRVIPKPSRATYPCQKVAFPLASGFVIWLLGIASSAIAFRKAKHAFMRARYILAAICITLSVGFIWAAMNHAEEEVVYAHEPIVHNSPMGTGIGVHPGRVAWIHDPNATNWDGSGPPDWHTNTCTDPDVVEDMLSKGIQALAGKDSDAAAWEAILREFNQRQGRENVIDRSGEKVAIKINFVSMYEGGVNPSPWVTGIKPDPRRDQIDNSPQLAIALIKQLTDVVGFSESNICFLEVTMSIANYWYDMVHAACPGVVFVVKKDYPLSGREECVYDSSAPFYWSDPITSRTLGKTQDEIPSRISEADYFINFAILKSHTDAGMTVCGKNHFGSLRTPSESGYYNMHDTRPLETPGMGHYRCIVDLMGHPKLGGKTMLCLVDGLYAGTGWDAVPYEWDMPPFNGDWPSSIFLSQDQVAADSVAFDFMDYEWDNTNYTQRDGYNQRPGTDDYLHEAALIPNPPSNATEGTVYDPNDDGGLTESLGVHEHWNNATDKQYSRNLNPITGTGIELVTGLGKTGDFFRDGVVNFKDFAVLAAAWLSESGDDNWNADCDISTPSDDIIDEKDLAEFCANWLS